MMSFHCSLPLNDSRRHIPFFIYHEIYANILAAYLRTIYDWMVKFIKRNRFVVCLLFWLSTTYPSPNTASLFNDGRETIDDAGIKRRHAMHAVCRMPYCTCTVYRIQEQYTVNLQRTCAVLYSTVQYRVQVRVLDFSDIREDPTSNTDTHLLTSDP